jgi:hypothetical protein
MKKHRDTKINHDKMELRALTHFYFWILVPTQTNPQKRRKPSPLSITFISPSKTLKPTVNSNTLKNTKRCQGLRLGEPILLEIPSETATPGVRKHRFIYTFMIQCLRRGSNRNMKKTTLLAPLLLSLITLSTMTLAVSATDYTKVGVKVGDVADYTYSYPTGNGTLDVIRFRIEILQIVGTNVTIDSRELYLNNSEGPASIYADDVSSIANQMLFTPYVGTWTFSQDNVLESGKTYPAYLVVADLSEGDNLFSDSSPSTWTPVITITMTAAGQTRTVNLAKYTGIELLPVDVVSYSNEAYYDKITGLLVASVITDTRQDGTKDTWSQILNSTTAFTGLYLTGSTILPQEETTTPTPTIAAEIAFIALTIPVAVTAAAAITQRRKLKTTTH